MIDSTPSRPGDPYSPYLRVGFVLAVLIIAVSGMEIERNFVLSKNLDFISFWGAGKLALAGKPALAYDNAAIRAVQIKAAAVNGGDMSFPYAPAFMLLVSPFALLPYPVALALWSIVTCILYLIAATYYAPHARWLPIAFPPVFVIAAIGQNGFVTAAAFLCGLALLGNDVKFAAGIALGCLVLKPQLALMLPIAMLAGREWRVIAGAITSSSVLMLGGLVLFGPSVSRAWLHQMPLYVRAGLDGLAGWHKLVSVYAAGRQAGLAEGPALFLHGSVAVFAAALVARMWHSDADGWTKAGVLGAASMLASPYVFLYDSLLLIPAFVCLVQRRAPVALVGLLWCAPILAIAQAAHDDGPINIGPVVPIVLLVLCGIRTSGRMEHRPSDPSSSTSNFSRRSVDVCK